MQMLPNRGEGFTDGPARFDGSTMEPEIGRPTDAVTNRQNAWVHSLVRISARSDYALRALLELAAAGEGPIKAERISQAQGIPVQFLENIMTELRRSGLVRSRRGTQGGYWLAQRAEEINLAQVIRAVEGPLANVRGSNSEEIEYNGVARPLGDVWVAVRASLRRVLEAVSLGDITRGELPPEIVALTLDAGA
jgi:Rrf2 family protein